MSLKIFLSHSANDEALASALVDCLLSSMVLEDTDLRCTSVSGHKLSVGTDFSSALLEDIGETSVVIGLITKTALSSSWVLFELGATWGSKKHLKPIVTGEVDLKALPGPVSGRHVARMSNRGDIAQLLSEVTNLIGATPRSAAKIDKAIETLLSSHTAHVAAQKGPLGKNKVETNSKELTVAGMPISELVRVLASEKIKVPAKHAGGKQDAESSLFDLFLGNANTLADGLQSNWDRESAAGFLYQQLGLRLLPYGLVQFEKLPASQAKLFKRLGVSPEGHKLLLQLKRLNSAGK